MHTPTKQGKRLSNWVWLPPNPVLDILISHSWSQIGDVVKMIGEISYWIVDWCFQPRLHIKRVFPRFRMAPSLGGKKKNSEALNAVALSLVRPAHRLSRSLSRHSIVERGCTSLTNILCFNIYSLIQPHFGEFIVQKHDVSAIGISSCSEASHRCTVSNKQMSRNIPKIVRLHLQIYFVLKSSKTAYQIPSAEKWFRNHAITVILWMK